MIAHNNTGLQTVHCINFFASVNLLLRDAHIKIMTMPKQQCRGHSRPRARDDVTRHYIIVYSYQYLRALEWNPSLLIYP